MWRSRILYCLVITSLWHVSGVTCQDEEYDAKYLILGAGIAGLAAGKHLTEQQETDFIIIEADSRIGGRVKSTQFGGKTVEVGAQWINSYSSPIGQLARRAGLATKVSDYDDFTVLDTAGDDVTDQTYDRYDTFGDALDYMHDVIAAGLEGNPYKPDISQRAALSLGGWTPRDVIDYAIEYYDHDFVYGHQVETASARYAFIPSFGNHTTYTENVVIDQNGGLLKIVKRLHDDFLQDMDPKLKLNHKVSEITYDRNGVTVTTDSGTFRGKYAIVTFSLGVLQNEAVIFRPPLPDWKRYSIMGAMFVTDIPIYLKFPSTTQAFWHNTEYILFASKRRGHFTLWQNFHKLLAGSGILQIQVSGEEARRLSHFLTDADIKAEIMEAMSKMYKRDIPEPDILVPRWYTDPLHYGTYSDRSPSYTNSTHNALRAPVDRIYFAGEAYHLEYFGYMEGAYHSAIDEIKKLLACDRDASKCEQFVPPFEAVGCTYSTATNYETGTQIDDGSCTFEKSETSAGSVNNVHSMFLCILLLLYLFV